MKPILIAALMISGRGVAFARDHQELVCSVVVQPKDGGEKMPVFIHFFEHRAADGTSREETLSNIYQGALFQATRLNSTADFSKNASIVLTSGTSIRFRGKYIVGPAAVERLRDEARRRPQRRSRNGGNISRDQRDAHLRRPVDLTFGEDLAPNHIGDILMRTIICACALAALVGSAEAATKSGVTMPDSIRVDGKTLILNGMGLRRATFLKVHVYVAGLYLEQPSSDPAAILASDQEKRIVLQFVRHVHRGDIVKAWQEGFHANATTDLSKIQPQIDELDHWMGDFSDGDTLTFTYAPGQGVTVDVNGTNKGLLPGQDFATSLFAIWLGKKPPTGDLKTGLLQRAS